MLLIRLPILLKDFSLGIEGKRLAKTYAERYTKGNEQYDKEKQKLMLKLLLIKKDRSAKLAPEQFVGTYRDAWFGDVVISKEKKGFRIICKSSGKIKGA